MNDVKFGKRDNTRISKIQNAGATQTMLAIKYKDKKGNLSERIVEPYKLIGNDFWAYDANKESIRRFKIKNLQSARNTKDKFNPRWPIEIGGVEMIKTSEFIDYMFEKTAGVEYGFRAYNDPDGKLSNALSEASLNDDWDKEDEIRSKMKSKGAHDFGFKWSEKPIANIPYEYGHKGLEDIMNGQGTSKLKGYRPLKNPYSGEADGMNFLADRDSAYKMLNHYGSLLEKMPHESTYDENKFNEVKAKYDALNAKIKTMESEMDKKVKNYFQETYKINTEMKNKRNEWKNKNILNRTFNIPAKVKYKKELSELDIAKNNAAQKIKEVKSDKSLSELKNKLYQHREEMYKATDRDIINQYRLSLQNSLKDKNNNMYEWGWF